MTSKGNDRLVYILCMITAAHAACPIRGREYFFNGLDVNADGDNLEDMCELSKPTLRTLLRGLITVLVQLYPDCLPPSGNKDEGGKSSEEPIKIFRQIMACPAPMPASYNLMPPVGPSPPTSPPPPPRPQQQPQPQVMYVAQPAQPYGAAGYYTNHQTSNQPYSHHLMQLRH